MKGLRSIPSILKINWKDGYKVSVLFNNGESRVVDFREFFTRDGEVTPESPEHKLLNDIGEFNQIEIIENTIGWRNIEIPAVDFGNGTKFWPYDLDPIVLFEFSTPDESKALNVGAMIKDARKAAGMTQTELAKKVGTGKHYISRLENNKSDIELLTLKKIVEAGLGKELKIQIV